MAKKQFSVAVFRYLHFAPIFDKTSFQGGDVELEFVDPGPGPSQLFRHQTQTLEFDISEMGLSTAIAANDYGVPITPIPIFPVRRFDYHLIYVRRDQGITRPEDLNGKTIALRSPNATVEMLCAAMLSDRYGVDLDSINWIVTGSNHIADAGLPERTELRQGADPTAILESGEAAAVFSGYKGTQPGIEPLFPDVEREFSAAYEYYGCTTVHHTIVLKNEILEEFPGLAEELTTAFIEAKAPFLKRANAHEDLWKEMVEATPMGPGHDYGIASQDELHLPDPVPYGVEANQRMLASFVGAAQRLKYLPPERKLDQIFACAG